MNLMTIDRLKIRTYLGSKLEIDSQVKEEEKFIAYTAYYLSDGVKIHGYLTIPKPDSDHLFAAQQQYPVVLFCHGYVPPHEYSTLHHYVGWMDVLARSGFVVFKPDYRGHGNSLGYQETMFEYGYTIDVLNAITSIKSLQVADTSKIGIWGHSMGGDIVLKVMEINPHIKAGVIWAAPAAHYAELVKRWTDPQLLSKYSPEDKQRREEMYQRITRMLGDPNLHPDVYNKVSPYPYFRYIQGPIQIYHCKGDEKVPYSDSQNLYNELKKTGKEAELILYENGDHAFSGIVDEAMQKSADFFHHNLEI